MFPPSIKVEISVHEIAKNPVSLVCSPNPTKGLTHISFSLEKPSAVSLNLIDINGRIIENILDNRNKQEGEYNMLINMEKYPAGLYYLSLTTDNYRLTEKVIIIR